MSRNEVSMVVSQDDEFESSVSFLKELIEKEVVISGVNEDSLMIRLNIITEDSKHVGFELSNVDSFFFEFGDELEVRSHERKCNRALEI